jgi:CubicO group peptidase (beta-lactamase class C family)
VQPLATVPWMSGDRPRSAADPRWPGTDWDVGPPQEDVDTESLDRIVATMRSQPAALGQTLALVAVHRGEIVAEMYGPECNAATTFISWSMAKSVTHALLGLLVGDGQLEVHAPAPVPAWADDARGAITTQDLLEMSSGLHFVEDYVDDRVSNVIEMLFGPRPSDHAAYAAAFPLDHPPGTVWNYSSGTTNILARIAGDIVGGGREGMETFLARRLFGALGMASAQPKFDDAGTFVGSSYVYATARDFARFGYLYLRDGVWDGGRILPASWVDHARTPVRTVVAADERHGYGAHWWHWNRDPSTLAATGYEGQRTIVSPARDLVVVRLGKSPTDLQPAVDVLLDELLECFPDDSS